MWDGADLEAGPHGGTFASEAKDGHGRTAFTTERFHEASTLRERITRTTYLPTNEPQVIKRELAGSTESVTRWMRYDTQARMVLNVEPNTTKGFTSNPSQDPSTLKAWRYVYNDAGDLVGTSDARGCGINFAYDGLGRLLTEDYSPCEAQHQAYSPPNAAARTGVEVLYHYDTLSPDIPPNYGQIGSFVVGRLVAVYDRASLTVNTFDGRGRSTESAVKVAKPGEPDNALAQRYAPTWYQRAMDFDSADREVFATNGTTAAELAGTGGAPGGSTRAVTTTYSKRGTVKSVQGSYGTLVTNVKRSADGLLDSVQYGDLAETKTDYVYDTRRRVSTVQTYRGPPQEWTATTPPYSPAPVFDGSHQPTFQLLLQDDEIRYDVVSNPTEVRDWRIAEEWPEGAKPVTKKAEYDDLYRVKRVDYQYATGDDVWKSPFDAENSGNPALQDSRRAKPSPHVAFDKRVLSQSYAYDWLGNTSASDDDAHGFYDRSLGTIGNGPTSGVAPKPYQLTNADNLTKPGTRTGRLAARYDDAGNLTRLAVDRGGPCLPTGSACNQFFAYEWDEVGRLNRARRWDISSSAVTGIDNPLPTAPAAADLSHSYDAGDQRVIKTARDTAGAERHTVYIFDCLELRRAEWKLGGGIIDDFDYAVTATTEVGYLFANGVRLARLVYEPTEHDVPTFTGAARLHVFFELGDHLGSTSVVLDKATGELVERATYEAYGSRESDYRPERWSGFREDYGFTGKEDDVEVGLTYFGKRFLSTHLNRWVNADPLAVHVPGEADSNLYAYVEAQTLRSVDPMGLDREATEGFWSGVKDQAKVFADGLINAAIRSCTFCLLTSHPPGKVELKKTGPNLSSATGVVGYYAGVATFIVATGTVGSMVGVAGVKAGSGSPRFTVSRVKPTVAARAAPITTELNERASQILNTLVKEKVLTKVGAKRTAVGVTQGNVEGSPRIVTFSNMQAHNAVKSGRVKLAQGEVLGPAPRFDERGQLLANSHVEFLGAEHAVEKYGATGGHIGTVPRQCKGCAGSMAGSTWTHTSPAKPSTATPGNPQKAANQ